MHLYTTNTGKIYLRMTQSLARTQMTLPDGVGQVSPAVRLDKVLIPGTGVVVMVGKFNEGLIWFPERRKLRKLGITAPVVAPTLAASGTGIDGDAIGVYTFAEIAADGTVVHESNPSPISNTLTLTNDGRAWSVLPTFHPNERVNFKRLYVSMDGDDFLFVANVPLNESTFTENIATAELPEDIAVSENRGVPPYSTMVTYYANRTWYAKKGSDTFWYSELNEPESVGPLNFLKTRDGRHITSIKGLADEIIIATRKSFQYVTGFGLSDFEVHFHSRDLGIIAHHGAIVVNDKLWFPWQDGYYRYGGGAFQFLMPTLRTHFREAYEADPDTYEDLVAAVDRRRHILKVLVPGESPGEDVEAEPGRVASYFVAHYLPCESELGGNGGLPFWSFDTSLRYEQTIEAMTDGDLLDRLYAGGCDSYVRLTDVQGGTPDDDGDPIDVEIWLKHFFMGSQGGTELQARLFGKVVLFTKSEGSAWNVTLYTGDDSAPSGTPARPAYVIPASAKTRAGAAVIPKTQHTIDPGITGHGITIAISARNPAEGFEFRGVEIYFSNAPGGFNVRPLV